MQDSLANAQVHCDNNYLKSKSHCIIPLQENHQRQLSMTADIPNIPAVQLEITKDILNCINNYQTEFRNYKYVIVDECNFTKTKCQE